MAEVTTRTTKASGATIPALSWSNYGRNIQAAFDASTGELHLRIACGPTVLAKAPMAKGTPQKPGKNKLLASTGGNAVIGNMKLGLNLMIAPEEMEVWAG